MAASAASLADNRRLRLVCRPLDIGGDVVDLDDLDDRLIRQRAVWTGLVAVVLIAANVVQALAQRACIAACGLQIVRVVPHPLDNGNGGLRREIVAEVRLEAGQRLESRQHAQAVLRGVAEPVADLDLRRGGRERGRLDCSRAQTRLAGRLIAATRELARFPAASGLVVLHSP